VKLQQSALRDVSFLSSFLFICIRQVEPVCSQVRCAVEMSLSPRFATDSLQLFCLRPLKRKRDEDKKTRVADRYPGFTLKIFFYVLVIFRPRFNTPRRISGALRVHFARKKEP